MANYYNGCFHPSDGDLVPVQGGWSEMETQIPVSEYSIPRKWIVLTERKAWYTFHS